MGAYSTHVRGVQTQILAYVRDFDELRFINNANVNTTMNENKITSLKIIVGRY